MSRPFVTLLPVLLAVAACEPPPPPTAQARADAATLAACREHADAVYDRTHRDSISRSTTATRPIRPTTRTVSSITVCRSVTATKI